MRVLLVSANTEQLNMPTVPVGLGLVAAATRRAGHEVTFLDLMFEAEPDAALRRAIEAARPEAIGISVRNIDDQALAAPRFRLAKVRPVIDACRAASAAPIVLGGAGYSLFPDEALAYLGADLGVRGEGEVAFPRLLERLARGDDPIAVPGVHAAGRGATAEPPFDAPLESLPLPDDDAYASADPARPDIWVPVESRRGCPNDCSYCSTARIQGRTIRARAPRAVAEHVARLAGLGYRRFYFVDNSFNIPEAHALELCRALAELRLGLEWRCILYPHKVSEALVEAMANAGCVEVALGFESGNERGLRGMNKRFSPDDVRRVSALLAEHGIRRIGFLLLGGPGETRESVEESLAFAESLGLDALRTTVGIRIYPGTGLAKRALAEGVIESERDLLLPRFYLAREVDPWLRETVEAGFRAR